MYGLITAPFNFNIMKSEAEIEAQKDSIINAIPDYFTYNEKLIDTINQSILKDASKLRIPLKDVRYLQEKLQTMYNTGVVSVDDLSRLTKINKKDIQLIKNDNVTVARSINSFFTPKQAYEQIVNDAPMWIDTDTLKHLNMNLYLTPNLVLDSRIKKTVEDEALLNLSLYEGEVLSGQKIIDRGEIINPRTFNILNSYMERMKASNTDKHSVLWYMVGVFLLVAFTLLVQGFYLYEYRRDLYRDTRSVVFILLLMILFVGVSSLMANLKMSMQFYVIPFAMIPILVRTFTDSRTAIMAHTLTIFMCMPMLPLELMPGFVIAQSFVGYVCILNLKRWLNVRS